jgi:hypothetical protein
VPNFVKVNYGRDWPNRMTNSISINPHQRDFEITLPTGDADIVAARLSMVFQGREIVWPYYDEDPAGQITMPDAKPRSANQVAPPAPVETPLINWEAPAGITLEQISKVGDVDFSMPRDALGGYPLILPRFWQWGKNENRIAFSVDLKVNGAENVSDYLPFAAPIDTVTRRRVKLPSGLEAYSVDFVFDATAHPGLTDLEQRFLLVPRGADLVIFKATGSPAAMTAQAKIIDAIWASVK